MGDNIINKVYVITDKENDQWVDIQVDFSDTKLELTKWDPLSHKKLTEKYIKKHASSSCNYLCSKNMIQTWISHLTLWKHIKKNKQNNVLILEDTASPVKDFEKKLSEFWKDMPKDWDMVYLGCAGSCDLTSFSNEVLTLVNRRKNKNIYKNGKLLNHLIVPGSPVGLYGYMLSQQGANKLIENVKLKKIGLNPEYNLPMHIINDESFKVYAFSPPLITQDRELLTNSKRLETHKIFSPILSKIPLAKELSLQQFINSEIMNYRSINAKITVFSFLMFILSFIIGFSGNNDTIRIFLILFTTMQLFEMAYTRINKQVTKSLIFEYIVAILLLLLGTKINKKI